MLDWELFIVSVLKALVEVAGMALLAQSLIGLIAGKAKQENFVQVITQPVTKLTRWLPPGLIADQHMNTTSFILLFWVWLSLIYAKNHICHSHGLACFGT